jgi:cell division protein FtsB
VVSVAREIEKDAEGRPIPLSGAAESTDIEMTSEPPSVSPRPSASARRGPPSERPRPRKALSLALFLILVASLLNFFFGDRGVLGLVQARRELRELDQEIAALNAENQRLLEEIRALKTNPASVEKLAREELGLLKPNEIVLILRKPAPAR